MKYDIKTNDKKIACAVYGFFADKKEHLSKQLTQDNIEIEGLLFPQRSCSTEVVYLANAARILILINCGSANKYDSLMQTKVIKASVDALNNLQIKEAYCRLPDIESLNKAEQTRLMVLAFETASQKLASFKSSQDKQQNSLQTIYLDELDNKAEKEAFAIAKGVELCKQLGNLPANICTPSYLAQKAMALSKELPQLQCKVLGEKEMAALKMNAFLAVSKGSSEEAKLIEFNYQGAGKDAPPIVLVGKGVTFDSGGLSLKPAANMDEMKFDMCGAASVFGVLQAVTMMALPINVVGIIASSENLPGNHAVKPGDIVTSMSGQTIEILNTDAEGRLLLCDALSYAQKFNPKKIIDIATLTGAMIIALGYKTNGLMSNSQTLANSLMKAGELLNDKAWQLPIWDEYQELIDSNIADISNIGSDRSAGSITAACFLARFIKDVDWAHIDCAGTAWVSGKEKAATGRPVPLLCQYLINSVTL